MGLTVGVTYCGKSDESSLTMRNVPFYEEVVEFAKGIVQELNRRKFESDDLPDYAIAAEHAHRLFVLCETDVVAVS
jgi:tRNA wybutosine-synthesizing protein 1